MLRKVLTASIVSAVILFSGSALLAQQPEVTVGEITLPSLRWGTQTANFTVTNMTDYPKTISVLTDVVFEGTYLNPSRHNRNNYQVAPGAKRAIRQPVEIPGNYGKAAINVQVYDVLDTLDLVLPYQKLAEQPFTITYHIPDELVDYFQEAVTLPPLVNNGLDFDSEFSRLMFLLMNEGKTPEQIASMTKADTSFVYYQLSDMARKGYLTKDDSGYRLRFPVITLKEAQEVRPIAEEIADELSAQIVKNMPVFNKTMDSLVAAGTLPPNPDDFMNGGSVLYYRYPAVAGLFLWYYLGETFINPERPLDIYQGTDYCNARIPKYMYAVQGGAYYNGTNFFDFPTGSDHVEMTFADTIPVVHCAQGFDKLARPLQDVGWSWDEKTSPEPFAVDTGVVRAAFQGLMPGVGHILQKAYNEYKVVYDKHGHYAFMEGARYWFWNLVASRTIIKLQEQGVLTGRGGGMYHYEEVKLR